MKDYRNIESLRFSFNTRVFPFISVFLMAGCASVPEDAQFTKVADQVEERSGLKVAWNVGIPKHPDVSTHIKDLLGKPLTADSSVQVALLNNPGLQAKYAELGIAQADLIQAGLFTNPTIGGLFTFPEKGGSTNLTFDLAFNFLDILMIPLRKAVAESEFEEVQLKMIKFTIDLATQTRQAYFAAQASQQLKEIFDQVLTSTTASYEVAKVLRQAGNISELELSHERSLYEQSKVDVLKAEANVYQSKLKLMSLMGVKSPDVQIQIDNKLPDLPKQDFYSGLLAEEGTEKSIDLAILKQRLETLGHRYHVTNITALIPSFGLGGEAEREEGHWEFGPTLEFTLPIFDQGQPAIAKAQFEIRGLQEQYANTVVQVHTMAHILQQRIIKTRQQVDQLHNVVLPLQQKILNQTQLHYNAMQIGVFDLIKAKQGQIEAGHKYVEVVLDYWLSRSALEQLMHGSLPLSPEGSNLLLGGMHP